MVSSADLWLFSTTYNAEMSGSSMMHSILKVLCVRVCLQVCVKTYISNIQSSKAVTSQSLCGLNLISCRHRPAFLEGDVRYQPRGSALDCDDSQVTSSVRRKCLNGKESKSPTGWVANCKVAGWLQRQTQEVLMYICP